MKKATIRSVDTPYGEPSDPLTLGDRVKALWQPQGGDPSRGAV